MNHSQSSRWIYGSAWMLALGVVGCNANVSPTSANVAPDKPAVKKQSVHSIVPGPNADKEAQLVFNTLKDGDVVEFAEGKFIFSAPLQIGKNGVTVKGKGIEKTILSFKGQKAGSQGLFASEVNGITFEDLSVEDAAKDCIKVFGSSRIVFRRVRAAWTDSQKPTNGAYGLYPVQSSDILMEDCIVEGSADAGVYVGQSKNIIVRRCKAIENVAGIEIENSTDADVYENFATKNSCGLLVFALPDLPSNAKKCERVRVYKNKMVDNNIPNFAPKSGAIVSILPPGNGMIVMAADQVEVFDNDFGNNDHSNLTVISYLSTNRPYKDAEYDPTPEGVSVMNNRFQKGGKNPTGDFANMVMPILGKPFPDIIFDGIFNPKKLVDGKLPKELALIVKDNGDASFVNVNLWALDPKKPDPTKLKLDKDPSNYAGDRPRLPAIALSGVN